MVTKMVTRVVILSVIYAARNTNFAADYHATRKNVIKTMMMMLKKKPKKYSPESPPTMKR